MALLAVTQGRPVGVDLEHHRPLPGRERLAARFFSAPEQAALASVPDGDEAAATFLRCWTRKEAYVKALGVGVFHDLEGFAVTCLAHEAPALTWSRADPDAPRHWSLAAPDVGRRLCGGHRHARAVAPGAADLGAGVRTGTRGKCQ